MNHNNVVQVTVTYGNRKYLLQQVVDAAQSTAVSKVVIIDNGATWPLRSKLNDIYRDFVDVVEMGHNTGSAPGYAAGIQRALDLGAEFIFLLDDDNRPEPGALPTLLQTHAELARNVPRDRLAVLAFRPSHQGDVADGVPARRVNPRPSSFLGFHVLDIPYKLWRRTPWGRPRLRHGLPARVDMTMAPYGGLLLHRDAVQTIGLPDPGFVLYGDDTEWTYRLHRCGGRIVLVTAARVDDLESSWSLKSSFGTSFNAFLSGTGDLRAYYGLRNAAYFFHHCHARRNPMFWVNVHTYKMVLGIFAVASGKTARYSLLMRAMRDGIAGRLGVNPEFPL